MYSAQENLDSTEFSGWINEDLLLKESRRSTRTTRKRRYDLTNVDIDEQCEDIRRRILRPRHNTEPQSSNGASRTRPIRSNRGRWRQTNRVTENLSSEVIEPSSQGSSSISYPDISSANDLTLFQALVAYSWPQNYLLAHTDLSMIQRLQQPTYSSLNSFQLTPRMPSFDPWILHNYLLASSNYPSLVGSQISPNSNHEDSSRNMSQLGYPSLIPEIPPGPTFLWQYPFLTNPSLYPMESQISQPTELRPNLDSHSDLSNLFRPQNTLQREVPSNSNVQTDRIHSGMYHNDLPQFNNHSIPDTFSYVPVCPYHNASNSLPHNQQSSHQMTNSSSIISENSIQFSQHPYNLFQQPSEMSFGHYWPPMTPSVRPVNNYPINSSNIDTLLHLAAHFEQKKRGITREELDRLPTHRYKTSLAEKIKQREKSASEKSKIKEDEEISEKCLVCLENFEVKQSIRTLRCTHEFHSKCIDKWLKINRTCPLCRADAFDGTAQKEDP